MISPNSYRAFWKALRSCRSFLITTHVNPDGDGLCSLLVMAMLLRSMKKDYYIVMEDLFPQRFRFLLSRYPGFVVPEYIHVPAGHSLPALLPEQFKPEALVIIDTHSLSRLGAFGRDLPGLNLKSVFLVDHHRGRISLPNARLLVEPLASSTSEVLYGLLRSNRARITRSMAELLYIGIVTDTKNFSQSNTSYHTHQIAGDLLRTGLKPEEVNYQFQEMPARTMKVFSRVMARFCLAYEGQVIWSFMRKSEINQCQDSDADGLIEMLRNVKGSRMAILFKEVGEKQIKICLRGKRNFNVFRIARSHGGGGHLQASGFLVRKDLKPAIAFVLKMIGSYL
jgi:phosphoesterase RecJ-like protein